MYIKHSPTPAHPPWRCTSTFTYGRCFKLAYAVYAYTKKPYLGSHRDYFLQPPKCTGCLHKRRPRRACSHTKCPCHNTVFRGWCIGMTGFEDSFLCTLKLNSTDTVFTSAQRRVASGFKAATDSYANACLKKHIRGWETVASECQRRKRQSSDCTRSRGGRFTCIKMTWHVGKFGDVDTKRSTAIAPKQGTRHTVTPQSRLPFSRSQTRLFCTQCRQSCVAARTRILSASRRSGDWQRRVLRQICENA